MIPTDKDQDEDEHEDEGEPEGEGWELDPNDPDHPDFDLSEAGYYGVEPERGAPHIPPALIFVVTVLLILALFGPACIRFFS
jgi:hypothetical protein